MGNDCHHFILNEPTKTLPSRTLTQVSNAPSNKYALRLKNKFPKLQPQIEQIRNKIKLLGVDQIIRECPIYFIYEKSAVYQGHWDNGEPHGYGRVEYSDFSYYEGLFKQSQACTFIKPDHHEDSVYIFTDGSYYRGEFNNSKFEGKGVLTNKDSTMKIVGNFKDGMPHGQVIETIETLTYDNKKQVISRSTYEGEFWNGVKQGKGSLQSDEYFYQGDFYNGVPHGEGQLVDYSNGIEFKGKFYKGKKMTGQQKSSYGIVRGNYKDNSNVGHGYYEWKEGNKFYIGGMKGDKLDGPGKIFCENGRIVEGVWKNGHNKFVTKIDLTTQSQIKRIKEEHEKGYRENNVDNRNRESEMNNDRVELESGDQSSEQAERNNKKKQGANKSKQRQSRRDDKIIDFYN